MKCPNCQFENRENAKFCKECGADLELACSGCGTAYEIGSKFCDECGFSLEQASQTDKTLSASEGERKHVTVLFSDLSGYTAMSEKLDPEAVKEITGRIFGETSEIIAKYDGFVEKYAGDAVMALFGVPGAHEDDPIRAIKAAREIHDCVEALSPEIENKIGQPISMHSGISTGLVGRKVEMAELSEALEGLHQGNGRIFSISGDAGTGKSRLVEEFKATLDLNEIQWLEGHAYAYA